jgi:hypothetical protein
MHCRIEEERKLRTLLQLFSSLRKIGDDLIIEARPDSISFRALNETQSALPVIQVASAFFEEYRYAHGGPQLAHQLPAQWIIAALKCNAHPMAVVLAIGSDILTVTVFDVTQIRHEWSLYLERASIMNAVFERGDVVASLHGRVDLFQETDAAFRRNGNICFALRRRGREKTCVLSSLDDTDGRVCTIRIQSNDVCDISFSEGTDTVCLSFSRSDFCVGIAMATVLAQRVTLQCIGPGYPVMMKASMPNSMQFQMAIATAIAEEENAAKADTNEEPMLTMPEREDRRSPTVHPNRTFASRPQF